MNLKKMGLLTFLAVAIAATLAWQVSAPLWGQENPRFRLVLVDKSTGDPYPWWTRRITVQCDEGFDNWLYVTNPSNNLSRGAWPTHVVEVNTLTLDITYPNGSVDTTDLSPGVWAEEIPRIDERWEPIVNPRENSLVFFVGWIFPCGDFAPGTYRYVYTLTVTYEGEDLTFTRRFWVELTP